MATINIAGVRSESKGFTVHIILTDVQEVEGAPQVVSIGEAFLPIPANTEMADVKVKIMDAAKGIMKAHKDSLDKRHDLEELTFPPIE